MKRRAQAALEFLTTYGWAFLVILIMIGALAYFGVLNPSNLVPDKCVASSGFSCEEAQVRATTTGAMVARVKNGLEPITINGALTVRATEATCTAAPTVTPSNPIQAGQVFTITVNCDPAVQVGSRPTFVVEGNYTPVGKTFNQSFSLEVSNKVQS
jgi:hypothetical protein